ncbi:MAG: hypothetical protein WBI06_06875, partial [Paludibacter sp.]
MPSAFELPPALAGGEQFHFLGFSQIVCNYWAKAHYIWNFIILIGLKPNPIHKLPPAFVLNGGGGFHRY